MMLIHKEKILWKKRSALDVVNCYHYQCLIKIKVQKMDILLYAKCV